MTHDYKNVRTRRERRPCWMWGLAGLILGAVGGYGLKIGKPATPATRQAPTAQTAPVPPPAAPVAKAPEPESRRYDFYTLLPEMELVVPPDSEEQKQQGVKPPTPKAPAPTATVSAPAQPGGQAKPAAVGKELLYVLQAGSFLQPREAEGMKANLALLGVQSTVQPVVVGDEVWHRVFIGPYRDAGYVDQLQKQLRGNQISTILVKTQR